MYKEIVICTIIIISIVTLDIFLQDYTKDATVEIDGILSEIKLDIENSDNEKAKEQLKELEEKWKDKHDILAYYIEHDELEKVDTAIVRVINYVENNDIPSAIAELETGKFVLKHIEEKYKFNLQNIF